MLQVMSIPKTFTGSTFTSTARTSSTRATRKYGVPGVLTVEALAQAGAVAILSQEEFKGKIAVFAGIDKCKFKQPIVPGDTARLETRITAVKGPVGLGEAVATVNGKVAVQATLKFAILTNS